ncbi:MAG: cupredoxin domain-containing protein [Actinomycetota bacterium]
MSFGRANPEVAAGANVSYVFGTEEVFPYFCAYHPGMVGAVVVGEGTLRPADAAGASEPAGGGTSVERAASRGTQAGAGPAITAVAVGAAAGGGLFGLAALRRRRNGRVV